ncbi:MAG: hypothetical protein B0D96_11365 [Candidatus Sedimenticola endophacoides]|uniref:Microcin J25-processing protein McjB C-terminal domain-containing protein n=1 Tax=Candidatus Sedimenticola endophacoides TaxID=2548426 RepID=A0A657PM53_9GAMM|nr:MAG: hypothetical protein B0D94_10175 [Candidatus Sedimenticola endophacoides]OQX33597.1 MAG: hypothetical protein B0D96_11365 [Candidatus Sedimenticola endophacoides]OQX38552.1 MAG: hypothetical protein B0D89_12535 [Candidatus Sedimenticola endophacoides]OQX39047.1 MAG: hypothetical protein B0D88_09690 [Candidatus Sedimenticola endophacoides]OQX43319.1 MAG: hypothetical protein B0D83_01555 [Candidatus Sedimenticola endophacoides]
MPSLQQRLRFNLSLWLAARILPFRVGQRPLDRVLALAEPVRTGRFHGLPPGYISEHVLRTTRHPWLMRKRRCLRQGLLGYRFLAEAGFCPELHFGVDFRSLRTGDEKAHCWVSLDGVSVVNDRMENMSTVLVHSSKGRME